MSVLSLAFWDLLVCNTSITLKLKAEMPTWFFHGLYKTMENVLESMTLTFTWQTYKTKNMASFFINKKFEILFGQTRNPIFQTEKISFQPR